MSLLTIEGLTAGYGPTGAVGSGFDVLKGVNLSLQEGAIACLLGASGSGKSTLLRCVAGFEPLRSGRIVIAGREVSSSVTVVPPEARGIGVVFQDYALFPHLTARANVAFGLGRKSGAGAVARVSELLQATELERFASRYPHELSGGQQQRVALARALAPRPSLLLMDEPFSNIDHDLARRMQRDLKALLRSAGTTVLMVTHDRDEAFDLADELGVLIAGELTQWGEPSALYDRPVSLGVAEALGECASMPAVVTGSGEGTCDLGRFNALPGATGKHLVLRPDDVALTDAPAVASSAVGRVVAISPRGATIQYAVQLASGREVAVAVSRHAARRALGDLVGVRLVAERPALVD